MNEFTLSRRAFLATAAASAATATTFRAANAANEHFLLSDVGCGRATGYAEANKIVTHEGKSHVAWIDSPEEGFRVRIRTLDHDSGEWAPTVTLGEGYDNHGGPSLTMDSEGYLHVAYYPHHHPMRYRRSLKPNDTTAWTDEELIGKTTTYPTLVCAPDDTLILTCRESSKNVPWEANRYIKKKGGDWEGPHTIIRALHMNYAHFMEALAWDSKGTLHLGTRIYGGDPRRGHTIGYMKSDDLGETWTRWDGSKIEMPATAETIDIVESSPKGPGIGLRAGAIAMDGNDVPHIICCQMDTLPSKTWIAKPGANGAWTQTDLAPFLPKKYEGWGVATPGEVVFNDEGTMYVVATLIQPPDNADVSIWGHPSSEPILFTSNDGGKTFDFELLTTPDPEVPRWLPNMERPTGHNRVTGRPGIIYTEGTRGDTNLQLVSNNVRWIGKS